MNDWKTKFKIKTAKEIMEMMRSLPPWRKSSLSRNSGSPSNALTQKRYSGINAIVLDAASLRKNYQSKYWATYRQWEALNLHVKKRPEEIDEGGWGTRIVMWEPFKEIKTNQKFNLMKTATVFNADQVFGLDIGNYKINEDFVEDMSEQIVSSTGAKIEFGNYIFPQYKRLPEDRICLPYRKNFKDESQFISARFHELIHWAEWRTGWQGNYEAGELIAEIGSCYLENEAGVGHCSDMTHYMKYLSFWLEEIEKNPDYLFEAATQASKAVNFILSFTKQDWEENV